MIASIWYRAINMECSWEVREHGFTTARLHSWARCRLVISEQPSTRQSIPSSPTHEFITFAMTADENKVAPFSGIQHTTPLQSHLLSEQRPDIFAAEARKLVTSKKGLSLCLDVSCVVRVFLNLHHDLKAKVANLANGRRCRDTTWRAKHFSGTFDTELALLVHLARCKSVDVARHTKDFCTAKLQMEAGGIDAWISSSCVMVIWTQSRRYIRLTCIKDSAGFWHVVALFTTTNDFFAPPWVWARLQGMCLRACCGWSRCWFEMLAHEAVQLSLLWPLHRDMSLLPSMVGSWVWSSARYCGHLRHT